MPNWSNLTLAELRSASHPTGKIVSEVAKYLNSKSKKEVVEMLMDTDVFSRPPVIASRPDKQIERREVETEDVLGNKTGSTVTTYSYFDTGEIEDIVISDCNASDVETKRVRIKHFKDGRQPVRIQKVP